MFRLRAVHDHIEDLEDWTAYRNQRADTAAGEAHALRPPDIWRIWGLHRAHYLDSCTAIDRFRALHLDVAAKLDAGDLPVIFDGDEPAVRLVRPPLEGGDWCIGLPPQWLSSWSSSEGAERYGVTFVASLVGWLREQICDQAVSVQISWFGDHPIPSPGKGERWKDPQHLPPAQHGQLTVAMRISLH